MDISARKMALIQWLIDLQDLGTIKHLESLSKSETDSESSLTVEELAGLDHALMQIEKGEVVSGEEVRMRLKSKYNL